MSDGRQCDVNATPNGSHCDSPKAETETDKKREETETHIPLRGQFANVKLTDEQVKKLDERFGESKAKDRIEILSEALASKKGYATKYKDHYATILSWARREGINGKQPDDNGNGGAFMEFIRKKAGLKDG